MKDWHWPGREEQEPAENPTCPPQAEQINKLQNGHTTSPETKMTEFVLNAEGSKFIVKTKAHANTWL